MSNINSTFTICQIHNFPAGRSRRAEAHFTTSLSLGNKKVDPKIWVNDPLILYFWVHFQISLLTSEGTNSFQNQFFKMKGMVITHRKTGETQGHTFGDNILKLTIPH